MTDLEAFTAAYMTACKGRAADYNMIGHWYFKQAWDAAIKQEREQTQALTNTAEQFVAWHKDKVGESIDPMIDYFEDIFSDALRARSEDREGS